MYRVVGVRDDRTVDLRFDSFLCYKELGEEGKHFLRASVLLFALEV